MGLISIVLLVIFAIAAMIMILVIMLQDDQGEGIGGLFGGGSATPFGSRSGSVLTRFTTILGAIFMIGAFALAWLNRSPETTDIVEKARLEKIQKAEESNWWVERIDETEAGKDQTKQGGESDLSSGINR